MKLRSLCLTVLLAVLILVSPKQGFAPLTVRVQVTVPVSEENQSLCVGYVGSGGEESVDCRTIDGASAPKTFWFLWKGLQAGAYSVIAQVEKASGKTETAHTAFTAFPTN